MLLAAKRWKKFYKTMGLYLNMLNKERKELRDKGKISEYQNLSNQMKGINFVLDEIRKIK